MQLLFEEKHWPCGRPHVLHADGPVFKGCHVQVALGKLRLEIVRTTSGVDSFWRWNAGSRSCSCKGLHLTPASVMFAAMLHTFTDVAAANQQQKHFDSKTPTVDQKWASAAIAGMKIQASPTFGSAAED